KEGFLRSATSLIQTIGRCARNVNAQVFLYADRVTEAMQKAIDETTRRRQTQLEFNKAHGITPQTIRKAIRTVLADQLRARQTAREAIRASEDEYDRAERIAALEEEMFAAAEALEFEKAARLRDRVAELKGETESGAPDQSPQKAGQGGKRRGS
ncbi:MAG: UvrB/UvrC motif-containing protein, partial [Phycisphaerae bacterium]|nr:UvrB/UvrC motif-containing protein [Phycisphaerae bacterium]